MPALRLLPILAAFLLGPAASADAAARTPPPQGIYESCNVQYRAADCIDRVRKIGAAGFRYVLNYQQFYADRAHLLAYADAAQAAGVQLIWPLKDSPWRSVSGLRAEYPELAGDCACDSDAAFLDWVIRTVKSHPATWGYYVGDETPPAFAQATLALSGRLEALDPARPRLFVAEGWALRDRLAPFQDAADVLGADSYPVGTSDPLSVVADVGAELRQMAGAGSPTAMVIQAFSWGQYPEVGFRAVWPSRSEMRTMRDLAVRSARPGMVLWYSFFDIQRSAEPARRWSDVVWAAFGDQVRYKLRRHARARAATAPRRR